MKIRTRMILLALLALLIGAAGCGKKEEDAPATDTSNGAGTVKPNAGTDTTNGSHGATKETGTSNPGGFGK